MQRPCILLHERFMVKHIKHDGSYCLIILKSFVMALQGVNANDIYFRQAGALYLCETGTHWIWNKWDARQGTREAGRVHELNATCRNKGLRQKNRPKCHIVLSGRVHTCRLISWFIQYQGAICMCEWAITDQTSEMEHWHCIAFYHHKLTSYFRAQCWFWPMVWSPTWLRMSVPKAEMRNLYSSIGCWTMSPITLTIDQGKGRGSLAEHLPCMQFNSWNLQIGLREAVCLKP